MSVASAANLRVFSSTAAAIDNAAYTAFAVGLVSGDATTSPVPNRVFLQGLEIPCTGISAGLVSLDVKITYDSAGDLICQPSITTTVTKGQTTATKATGFASLDTGIVLPSTYQNAGVLYVWVKPHEAGATATTCQPRLYGGI